MKLLKKKVLLLNNTYEALAIMPVKKVLKKLMSGSTSLHVLEYYEEVVETPNHTVKIPSVVRLTYHLNLKKNVKSQAGKKAKIFARDSYKCFYCGYAGTNLDLTLDHIIPKSVGGDSSANNLITACKKCNSAKNDQSIEEFGFTVPKALLHSNINFAMLVSSAKQNPQWKKYLYN